MRTEKLELHHKKMLTAQFMELGIPLSEYNFANLYLFRKIHEYEVIFTDPIFIKGKTRDGVTYYMPTKPLSSQAFYRLQEDVGQEITVFPIPEQWLNKFACPHFTHEALSADSDYLYKTEQMRTYPGRGLSGQRNQVKQFLSLYSMRVIPLTSETRQEAISILEHWQQNGMETDFESCLEAIQLHDQLDLRGEVYEVNGKPGALIIGSALTPDTFLFQFAKADTQFKGIYQFAYQHYAQGIDDQFQFINMEQDLGIPGLHKTKMSYHPIKIATKWRIHCCSSRL